jgi:PAS domain S-box-containing protein
MNSFPPKSSPPPAKLGKALAQTCALTLLGMTAFEVSKQLIHPAISIWGSHAVTIVFSGILATVVAFFVVRKQQALTRHLLETLAEQQKIEKILQENQRFLQRIADTTPHILYLYDLIEKRNVYVNEQVQALLGYSPEQVQSMGSSLMETLLHPVDMALTAAHFERIAAVGERQVVENEYRLKHADGEWRWFLSRDSVFTRTTEGKPRFILGTAEDITLRKQAMEALWRTQSELERRAQERAAKLSPVNTAAPEHLPERKQAEQLARDHTALLTQSLQSLASNPTLDAFLAYAMRAVAEQLDALFVTLYSCDWERNCVRLVWQYTTGQSRPAAPVDDPRVNLSSLQFSTEDLIVQILNRTPAPLIIEHVAETPLLTREVRAWATEAGVGRMLFVPLFSQNRLFGVMRLCNRSQRHYYRVEEIDFAQALAHQAALAWQLTRLSEQEQRAAIFSERTRMAREIHDTLSQGFTGIIIQLEGAEDIVDNDAQNTEELRLHLQRARVLARESLAEARRSVWELRPSLLEQGDLTLALPHMVEQLTSGTGIQAVFACDGTPSPLPPFVEESLFRVAQEALSNALLHAQAQTVRMVLTFAPQEITLEVDDDGHGFEQVARTERGFGLISMQERMEKIGGRLTIATKEGQGTTLCAVAPRTPRRYLTRMA